MCFLGLLGVAIMILISELSFTNMGVDGRVAIWIIQLILTISTVILVGLVLHYHRLNLILHSMDKSMNHWRIGLTKTRFALILLEVVICAVHPFPRSFPFHASVQHENRTMAHSSTPPPTSLSSVSVNVALGLPSKDHRSFVSRLREFPSSLSVCSDLFALPFGHVSFTSVSKYVVTIAGLSQSSVDEFLLPSEDLSRSMADPVLVHFLCLSLLHRQLVIARLQCHCQ